MPATFPRVGLLDWPSPLELLPNLSADLGVKLYVKRDDVGGRGGGGNKLRKYERIIGQALAEGADTLIIAVHYQSNAARELVGAARQLGLHPVVVCKQLIPNQNDTFNQTGNALLVRLMDAELVPIDVAEDFTAAM